MVDNIPEAPYKEGSPQMQITSLDYSKFVGRIAIGRIFKGDLHEGRDYILCKKDGERKKVELRNYMFLRVWVNNRL